MLGETAITSVWAITSPITSPITSGRAITSPITSRRGRGSKFRKAEFELLFLDLKLCQRQLSLYHLNERAFAKKFHSRAH
jgi:hypothetical protein